LAHARAGRLGAVDHVHVDVEALEQVAQLVAVVARAQREHRDGLVAALGVRGGQPGDRQRLAAAARADEADPAPHPLQVAWVGIRRASS
jgi:hypothetical protein